MNLHKGQVVSQAHFCSRPSEFSPSLNALGVPAIGI